MNKLQKGFTLLELMFVTIIIALLASIAVPIYQDYASKTQIHALYHTLSNLKIPVDLTLLHNQSTTDAVELGWISGSTTLIRNIPTVSVDADSGEAFIEATLDGDVYPVAKGTVVKLAYDAVTNWSCTITKPSNEAWKDSYAPKNCIIIP